ncbi:MAG TPA: sodium-dependent transporter [Rhodothermales bacterium]|nr:sodium-dependent transporter [Rhodothermales bacterium]
MAEGKPQTQRFTSRIGLLLSVLGIAVGTGNIWRFPRIVAQNSGPDGAGAFLVAWVIFLFTWSIPLIIVEYAMGKRARQGVVGAFAQIAGERMAWMGAFVGFVSTAIMFYYAVVTGWCFFYFVEALTQPLPQSTQGATLIWNSFQAGSWPILFLVISHGLAAWVLWKGVSSIERVSLVLMPLLFGIILLATLRAVTLPGAGDGLSFLFTPDWNMLARPRVWLEALTQNAWDTGAGWGLILTYAAYMRRDQGTVKNAFITGIGNNTVSMLAAVIVFGTVFATLGRHMPGADVLDVMKTSGPASTGLTFIWLPQLFAQMPLGRTLAVLFFLGLSFAAFTSLVSMIELATRVLVDWGVARHRALVLVVCAGFVFGIPSAINLTFLGNQDFVWGIGLMVSGLLFAIAVRKFGIDRFRGEAVNGVPGDWRVGRAWGWLIGALVPLEAVCLLLWWFYLSITSYAPHSWYNPIDPYSVATCLVQWGIVLAAFIAANKWMVRRTLAVPELEA